MSTVIKCFQKWKSRVKGAGRRQNNNTGPDILRHALLALIRTAQYESFGHIIKLMQEKIITFENAPALAAKQQVTQLHSIKKFVPFLDSEGILRVGGRLENTTDLTEEARHPALLPENHQITKLFVLDRHEQLAHRDAQ